MAPRTRFPVSQQRLQALRVTKLKNLNDVDIEFDDQGLTAILGPNGFGKSTVLHALAASFAQPPGRLSKDYRFTDFFPNTPHGVWTGSNFLVAHKYRLGPDEHVVATLVGKELGQWKPVGKSRPIRETHFLGVKSAVPKVETQGTRKRIKYLTEDLPDEASAEIRARAGYIFDRDYTRYHKNVVSRNRSFIGVEFRGINYSSLAMGAGEQRVFEILSKVINAGNYSLILIDEIDLLLHAEALKRLLEVLNGYSQQKNLQIIFTTHRESILDFDNFIAVRHLYQSPLGRNKTFCFKETKPDAISRLTGQPHRPLSVACEDDVATAIIEKVATQAGVRKYTEITRFGAADNCFTLIAALLLNDENLDDSIFVIDGDRYQTDELKEERMKKVLSGNHPVDKDRRARALSYVRQFVPKQTIPPEKRLHELICTVQPGDNPEINDVISAAHTVGAVANDHEYVDRIIEAIGSSREVGLSRIVNVAAMADGWNEYVAPFRDWLDSKYNHVVEATAH